MEITKDTYEELWGNLEESFHAEGINPAERAVTDALDNILHGLGVTVRPSPTGGDWRVSQECDIGHDPHWNIGADGVCIANVIRNKADAAIMVGAKALVDLVVQDLHGVDYDDMVPTSQFVIDQLEKMGIDVSEFKEE